MPLARRGGWTFLTILVIQSAALAECPIPAGGAVFVRVPVGNLVIDTSATEVEAQVSNSAIEVQEACFADHVEISGIAPERVYGPIDWEIRVPDSVSLDLVTLAGSIRISNTDGNVTARTTGGSVIVGDIGGDAAMVTQGGSILAGNIGGSAELRSLGGEIQIGNVTGNAELETLGGPISTGTVSGQIRAETAGGSINIQESQGELTAITLAGDIVIGSAGRTTVRTAGGNIIGLVIRGPFQGSTDIGNIRVERAESSIEARAGIGDIEVQLIPLSLDGDLHISLDTNSGNIRLVIPDNLPADVDARVDRGVRFGQSIRSDFPLERVDSRRNLPAFFPQAFSSASIRSELTLNGGGNRIEVHTSQGSIEILTPTQ
jgi:DUF4097 and DUF4098 domain-containing protein YvlB